MAAWWREALERFPKFRKEIDDAGTVVDLWCILQPAFKRAYDQTPPDEDMIARVYSYADWCVTTQWPQDPGGGAAGAVYVGFYETIPEHPVARADMPRWFRIADIEKNRLVFAWGIGDEKYLELLDYVRANQHRYVERASSVWHQNPSDAVKRGVR